jgi:hypothetical protein
MMELKSAFKMLCFTTKNKIMDNVKHISVHWHTITNLQRCLNFMLLKFYSKFQTVMCFEYPKISSTICPCNSHKIFSNIRNFLPEHKTAFLYTWTTVHQAGCCSSNIEPVQWRFNSVLPDFVFSPPLSTFYLVLAKCPYKQC